MEVRVNIPFVELLAIVRQLPAAEKRRLRQELDKKPEPEVQKQSRLTELLLSGPTFTEEQIKAIEETRKSINQWRTTSL